MKSRKFNMLSWLRSLVSRIMPDTLNNEIYDNDMDNAINQWLEIYNDNPAWSKKCHNKTLNLGTTIASEFARLIMIEFQSEITGSLRADFLNEQYQRLISILRVNLEKACAVGGIVFKPYVQNGNILTDCITQDSFLPIAYNNNEITGAIFFAREVCGKLYYTRVEKQVYDYKTHTHTIENRFFVSNSYDKLGKETNNTLCFPDIVPFSEITDVDHPLFAFWRVPFANQIEPDSPLGVSIYSRAIKQLQEADLQWDRYLWEFQGGTLAVHAGESLLRRRNVSDDNINQIKYELPEASSRLFRTFTGGGN